MGDYIGYARVSTEDQDLERQIRLIEEYHHCFRIYQDKCSGKDTARPEFQAMMDFVREGDTLIVESYSRLSRSTRDLLNIVDNLKQKKVNFVSIKEQIDTTTPAGEFMLKIFASLADYERAQMLQRQAEGIAIAKEKDKELIAAGKPRRYYKGRPVTDMPRDFPYQYARWKAGLQTASETYRKLDLAKSTFYRMVKAYESGNVHGMDDHLDESIKIPIKGPAYSAPQEAFTDRVMQTPALAQEAAENAEKVTIIKKQRKTFQKYQKMAADAIGCTDPEYISKEAAAMVELARMQYRQASFDMFKSATELIQLYKQQHPEIDFDEGPVIDAIMKASRLTEQAIKCTSSATENGAQQNDSESVAQQIGSDAE